MTRIPTTRIFRYCSSQKNIFLLPIILTNTLTGLAIAGGSAMGSSGTSDGICPSDMKKVAIVGYALGALAGKRLSRPLWAMIIHDSLYQF